MLSVEEVRDFCLLKIGVTESFPFDEKTLVFKVADKIFLLVDIEEGESVNLKCDPEKSIQLREEFTDIIPGYHMNKKHWNTVMLRGNLSNQLIFELINHSYDLVIKGLPKKIRDNF